MISVIVYGRNDSHGYNLHRRAALSLNCIAHVLTDDDDEILFVDYNTPPEMPVFPEAIRDTLTDAAVDRLRVIRVPADVHEHRYGRRTSLATVEPVARNVALRRSNPANRWVLATNTDMVFVPSGSDSLSDIVADLPDAYWAIPRFQLPEALWERLDRRMPAEAVSTIGGWGPRFHLDEAITSYDWMPFDAPGDFQLVPREWLWNIDGFDETMVLGWHVDSNLARRISIAYEPPRDLQASVRGYHCDHTRVPGVYHGAGSASNDVDHFVFEVERGDLPAQADTWGLAGVRLEELDLSSTIASELPAALEDVLPVASVPLPSLDARAGGGSFSYPADHVVPYVGSALSVLPRDAVIGYVGANPQLVVLSAAVMARLGFESSLRVLPTGAGFEQPTDGTLIVPQIEISRAADVVIVDFGLPATRATVSRPTRISDWTNDDRHALDRALTAFDELTRDDVAGATGARPLRSYIVVNAIYNAFEGPVDARLTGGNKQFATRVRNGYARTPGNDTAASLPRLGMRAWSGDLSSTYQLGDSIDLTDPQCALVLVGAWGVTTSTGAWTDGARAGFVFDLDPAELQTLDGAVFTVRIDRGSDPRRREVRRVDVEVAGEHIGHFEFAGADFDAALLRTSVSSALLRGVGPLQIDLVVHEPVATPDGGANDEHSDLGLLVSGTCLDRSDEPLAIGARVETRGPRIPGPVLWSGWCWPEGDGTWSIGPTSTLRVPPVCGHERLVDVVIELADVFVRPGQDPLDIEVLVNDALSDRWSFDRAGPHERRLTLTDPDEPTLVTLRMPAAVSGSTLGESSDPRLLGCKVAAISVVRRTEASASAERGPAWPTRGIRRLRRAHRRGVGPAPPGE